MKHKLIVTFHDTYTDKVSVRTGEINTSEVVEYMNNKYSPSIQGVGNIQYQYCYGEKMEVASNFFVSSEVINFSEIKIIVDDSINGGSFFKHLNLSDKTIAVYREGEGSEVFEFFYIVPDSMPKVKLMAPVYYVAPIGELAPVGESVSDAGSVAEERYIRLINVYKQYLSTYGHQI